ncbi:MAG: hypothetical protein PHG96_04345 [Kiritimatiellae bacterium]|nr:hypothetical protein [Kiritimatiellia bacterium]MDD4026438.1 hypothetical protein [Kiritimatiellia bacterium]
MEGAKPETRVYVDGFNLYYGALRNTALEGVRESVVIALEPFAEDGTETL